MPWVGRAINGSEVFRSNNNLDRADRQAPLTPSKLKVTSLVEVQVQPTIHYKFSSQQTAKQMGDHRRLLLSIICPL